MYKNSANYLVEIEGVKNVRAVKGWGGSAFFQQKGRGGSQFLSKDYIF
jgi:hypothetical protein